MEEQRWRREWRSALIVKVLGRSFPFPVISKRLESLWAKCGVLQISSLSYGFYAVRFTSQMDYERAAAGGPWMIGEHYITIRPWRRNFNPKLAEVASTMVWAKLPDLPREFINREAVERIASKIGRPIRVDRATQTGDRGRFARVSVEVDLTKPLLSQYKIEGITYYVEFEGLHNICTECGRYGHSKKNCSTLFKAPAAEEVAQQQSIPSPAPIYGEWMMAKSRKGNQKRKTPPVQANRPQPMGEPPSMGVGEASTGSGSRFQVQPTVQSSSSHANPGVQNNSMQALHNQVKDTTTLVTVPVLFEAAKKPTASLKSQPSGATALNKSKGKQQVHGRMGQKKHQKAKATNSSGQPAQAKERTTDLTQGGAGQPPGQPTAQTQLKDKGAKGLTENGPPPAL
ncbi:unnamed protein product [Linum trigynum]|uniref:CCHC-type domain-containing protein n=1 Tax=Linum trigynum TaxID=586398 RepID=A0AAV2CJT2_9ROSI